MFDNTLEGSVANYTCDFGFRLVGNSQRQCQSDASWSGTVPTCMSEYWIYIECKILYKLYVHLGIDCGDPGEPQNGTAIFDLTFVGNVVDYECDTGFQLVGDSQRTCQESGLWTGSVPQCERKHCTAIQPE